MSKKFYSWEFWDWGSILDTLLLLSFLLGLFIVLINGPGLIRKRELKKLDTVITAKVTSVKKYESVGIWGNSSKIYLNGIVVTYNYIVNNVVYSRWEVVPNETSTGRFEYTLLAYPESTIYIKYSSKDPGTSLIVVDSL